jgi:ornithine--oxo-acid transaminase
VLVAKGNFWGRTITASGACDDPHRYTNFGPFTPGFELVNYNDIADIRTKLEQNGKNICGVMLEPIQGEAGVIIPDAGYLK